MHLSSSEVILLHLTHIKNSMQTLKCIQIFLMARILKLIFQHTDVEMNQALKMDGLEKISIDIVTQLMTNYWTS